MESSAAASKLLREEQERSAQNALEHREWLKGFTLLFMLIVLTLTVATVLANLGADGTI